MAMSPEYIHKWKTSTTPKGRVVHRITASARPTSEKDYSGWPTAATRDYKDTQGMAREATNPDGSTRTRLDQLARVAFLTGWPTSRAADGTGHQSGQRFNAKGQPLSDALPTPANLAGWPKTPQASDAEGGVMEIRPGTTGKYKLRDYAQITGWATTTARDNKSGGRDAPNRKGAPSLPGLLLDLSRVPTGKRVVLDAAFSRWLMGYPAAWDKASPNFEKWQTSQDLIKATLPKPSETGTDA